MAYELKEENIDEFLASFRNDETRRDRLLDEIYIPSSFGRDNDTSDDLLALTQRKYILTHNDGLVNPLYAVKNLAIFALCHEMSDRLTFVENPLAMKDDITLAEAREYVKQFDRVAEDKYKGGVDGLEAEIKKNEDLVARLYEEGYKYDRVNSVNLFSNINNCLYGRRDRLRFYPVGKPLSRGKIFNDFNEVYKFYERIKTMTREFRWHYSTAEVGEKMFAKINALAEEYSPVGEWDISITEDGKTVFFHAEDDEDKIEVEELISFINAGLDKPEKKPEMKITSMTYSTGHITGIGVLNGKRFAFERNTALNTLCLAGVDQKYSDAVMEKIAEMQAEARLQKKKKSGLVR